MRHRGKNEIVLDLEIQDHVVNSEDWLATNKMKISCCVIYFYYDDRYRVFGPNDINYIQTAILMANRVIGYNLNKFDIPIIYGLPANDPETDKYKRNTYDILVEVWKAKGLDPLEFTSAHKNWGLDSVAMGTFGYGKCGSGRYAPDWYHEGNIWKVIDYCINDVALTKEVYEHIESDGTLTNRYGSQVKLSC